MEIMKQTTTQEVKNVLYQYKRALRMIKHLNAKIMTINEKMVSTKSGKITDMPKGGVPITVDDMLADKDDLEKRKKRFEMIAKQKKEIVQTYIDTVYSPKHNDLLTMYYIKDLTIEDIAKQMPCSIRHAWRLFYESIDMVDISINL